MSNLSHIIFHLVDDNDIDIAVNSKLLQIAKISDNIFTYSGAGKFLDYIKSDQADLSVIRRTSPCLMWCCSIS